MVALAGALLDSAGADKRMPVSAHVTSRKVNVLGLAAGLGSVVGYVGRALVGATRFRAFAAGYAVEHLSQDRMTAPTSRSLEAKAAPTGDLAPEQGGPNGHRRFEQKLRA